MMATIEEYVQVNNRVDAGERDANRARWEFGKMMLTECDPNGKKPGLPAARMDELVEATGLPRTELKQRMRFARECPTENDLVTIVTKYPSWEQIKKSWVKPTGRRRKLSDDRPPAPKVHDRADEVIALHNDGMSYPQIAEATGVGHRQVRHIIEREHIEAEAVAEAEFDVDRIDWATVPATVQKKLEAFRRRYAKQLEAEFEPRVQAAVQVRLAEAQQYMDKVYNEYRAVLGIRKGIFTRAEYDLIRSCLHPDGRLAISDEKLANAFRVFNEKDILLLSEANRPTTTLPASLGEMLSRRKGSKR